MSAGLHGFSPDQLTRYREAVVDGASGAVLRDAIRAVSARGFELNEPYYKRLPQGFAADHPNAALLRHNGLYAWRTDAVPEALFGPGAVAYCQQIFTAAQPIHAWLVAALT